MGRKKRKTVELDPAKDAEELAAYMPPKDDDAAPPADAPAAAVVETSSTAPASSSYAVTSHSAEIVGEDIYVSDGSEDEEDELAEIMLAGSRMGLMRRGLAHQSLMQPNRQWQRETPHGEATEENDKDEEEKRERELAQLDPAERASRLLAEKQRKLEEAKDKARRTESEENAGRDPCLFSKRTAFDIRMDQIEDKPWNNGSDITDYFNYTMNEQDWLEYSQLQLQIRQELTDANRQKRPTDPNIVPVTPKTPQKQAPRVAVAVRTDNTDDDKDGAETTGESAGPVIGPEMVKDDDKMDVDKEGDDEKKADVSDVGGGAWAAGAAPGSKLAQLIEEQERKNSAAAAAAATAASATPYQPPTGQGDSSRYSNRGGDDYYGGGGGGGGGQDHYSPPTPRGGHFPPNQGGPPPSYRGRGRGFRPPGPNNMPPPWAGRGHRGGFRGGYNDSYGGGGGYRR